MSTEHERISRIRSLLEQGSAGLTVGVAVGIGDDCAVLTPETEPEAWTVDVAVENVHFRTDKMPLEAVGYRAFMAAASDLAAMGARAKAALSSLILPVSLRDAELEALVVGLRRAAEACACPIVGGNLSRGRELSLTTSVLGVCLGKPVLRSGAQPGDGVFVTGRVGSAALGRKVLFEDRAGAVAARFVQAFLEPHARLDLSAKIAAEATSAIDLSDGLVQDAEHLARASGATLCLEWPKIPRDRELPALCRQLSLPIEATVLAGGEDYEVLFTAPLDAGCESWASLIGQVKQGAAEVQVLDGAGGELLVEHGGFDHFARKAPAQR